MGIDFEIVISPDFMEANLEVNSSQGAPQRRSGELVEGLKNLELNEGFDLGLIERIEAQWQDPNFWFHGLIAAGKTPALSRPGYLIAAFCPFLLSGDYDEYDRVDFNERHRLISFQESEILARRYPARPGSDGYDLRGQVLKAEAANEDPTSLGQGVACDAEGFIRATRNGVVVHKQGIHLDVVDVYEHRGPVGHMSGNLRSRGSLVIRGDVQPGFRVEADGDLVVIGDIDQASFRSGSNTEVMRAIIGAEGIQGRTAGDLSCRRLLAANLTVGGDLQFDREMVNCRLRAQSVESDNPRGAILSSDVKASEKIRCARVGSPAAAGLSLAVGLDWALQDRIRRLEATQISRGKSRRSSANGRGRSARRNQGIDEKLASLKFELRRRQKELAARASIEITRKIHAGTSVAIGGVQKTLEEDCGPVRFVLDSATGNLIQEILKR